MEQNEAQQYVILGIKIKPGPIERIKIENFNLDNSVDILRKEAEKNTGIPASSLELIHHGKILRDNTTLSGSGIKSGEMIHVMKKKVQNRQVPLLTFSDTELQHLNTSMRTLGCTPHAPGWTRAMQLLNDESVISDIIEQAPSLGVDCTTISIIHEVELLAALGANVQTMRRGADAHPDLPNALRHLLRLVCSRCQAPAAEGTPTSGFAYSLEALSEDEDVEEEEGEEAEGRNAITQDQLAAALQAATEAVLSSSSRNAGGGSQEGLLQLLQGRSEPQASGSSGNSIVIRSRRSVITPEMFNNAITDALSRATTPPPRMDQSITASSSEGRVAQDQDFSTQLHRMHEMGLVDDAMNVRALLICAGDVNAAINLVFSGAIGDE